jgi:hypothetical protein
MIFLLLLPLSLLRPPADPLPSVEGLGAPTYAARELAQRRIELWCTLDERFARSVGSAHPTDPEIGKRLALVLARARPCPSCGGKGGVWVGDVRDPQRWDGCWACGESGTTARRGDR